MAGEKKNYFKKRFNCGNKCLLGRNGPTERFQQTVAALDEVFTTKKTTLKNKNSVTRKIRRF